MVKKSEISQSHYNCHKVQDSYTLRCLPQIHGITHDTIKFVYDILKTECNSATDNPAIFADLTTLSLPRNSCDNNSISNTGSILSGESDICMVNIQLKHMDYLTL